MKLTDLGAEGTGAVSSDSARPKTWENRAKKAFSRYKVSEDNPDHCKVNTSSACGRKETKAPLIRKIKNLVKLNSLLKKTDASDSDHLFSRSEESCKAFDKIFSTCINAKTGEEARNSIDLYYKKLGHYYQNNPPSHMDKDKHYQQMVAMSAKVMSFSFQLDKNKSDENKSDENKIALAMELLQQILNGSQTSAAINNQLSAVLGTGMKTPEQKDFLFGTCLNTQIISVDNCDDDIRNLDRRLTKLNEQLANASGETHEALSKTVAGVRAEREKIARKKDELLAKEKNGMHSQKDFFCDCYNIILNQIQADVWSELGKQSELQGKAAKYKYNISIQLADQIIKKIDPILKEKVKSVTKNTANQKLGIDELKLYHQKKLELTQLLMNEISNTLYGKKGRYDMKGIINTNEKSLPVSTNNTKKENINSEQKKSDFQINNLPDDKIVGLDSIILNLDENESDEIIGPDDITIDLGKKESDKTISLDDITIDLREDASDETIGLDKITVKLGEKKSIIISLKTNDPESSDPEGSDNQDPLELDSITISLDDILPPETQ